MQLRLPRAHGGGPRARGGGCNADRKQGHKQRLGVAWGERNSSVLWGQGAFVSVTGRGEPGSRHIDQIVLPKCSA